MKNDLFDDESIIINCIITNKFNIKVMININAIDYYFINRVTAQKVCEIAEISSIQLNKSKKVRAFDERFETSITHAIYLFLKMKNHFESIISMLITDLDQQILILEKSWMRKHEMSYHEHTNFISFHLEHCDHLRVFERLLSKESTPQNLSKAKSNSKSFTSTRILKRDEFMTWLRELNQIKEKSTSSQEKVDKNRLMIETWRRDRESHTTHLDTSNLTLNIAMIDEISFNLLIR